MLCRAANRAGGRGADPRCHALCRDVMGPRSAGRGAHRSHSQGRRYAVCLHQPARRQRTAVEERSVLHRGWAREKSASGHIKNGEPAADDSLRDSAQAAFICALCGIAFLICVRSFLCDSATQRLPKGQRVARIEPQTQDPGSDNRAAPPFPNRFQPRATSAHEQHRIPTARVRTKRCPRFEASRMDRPSGKLTIFLKPLNNSEL